MMKTALKTLLVLLLSLSCLLSLASCAEKPELDLDDAKDNLEDAGYYVSVREGDDDEPQIDERLYAYDDNNHIYIICFNDTKSAKLYYEARKAEQEYEEKGMESYIEFYEHILDEYEDKLSNDDIDDIEDEIKDVRKEMEEESDNYVIGRSGKIVWYGTLDAVEDSRD